MKLFAVTILLISLIFENQAVSQDTIWFLSGEKLITSNYKVKVDQGILTYINKRNKEKISLLENVFSINEKNGYKKIYFEPVIIDNTPFSVEQMWSFIKGESEAWEKYKCRGSFLTGFVSGFGGVFLLARIKTPFYAPIVPATTSMIIGVINPSSRAIKRKYPQYASDEYFIAGYKEIASQKRIGASINGGIVGLAAGVVAAIIIANVN